MALIGEIKYLTIGGNTYSIPEYNLPIASSSTLGGIKVGTNLSIDSSTGVLSVTGIPTKVSDLTNDAGYITSSSIPIASSAVLGGVKIGDGLNINSGNGILSVDDSSFVYKINYTTEEDIITADKTFAEIEETYLSSNKRIVAIFNDIEYQLVSYESSEGFIFSTQITNTEGTSDMLSITHSPEDEITEAYNTIFIESVISPGSPYAVSGGTLYNTFQNIHSLPSGGTTGQFLVKSSATNYDVEWITVPSANGVSF